MKNKRKVLLITIISFIALILLALFFKNVKNSEDEYLKTVVKNVFSEDLNIRTDAIDKLELLAKEGNPIAQWRYGEVLLNTNKTQQAFHLLEDASEAGELKATEILGMLYLENKNILKGFNFLNRTANNELPLSQSYLGRCFESGECGFSKNDYLAFYWLTLADKNGDSGAQYILEDLNKFEIDDKMQKKKRKK